MALNIRCRLCVPIGLPIGVVNTNPASLQRSPAASRSSSCRVRCTRKDAATTLGSVIVRRLRLVFGLASPRLVPTVPSRRFTSSSSAVSRCRIDSSTAASHVILQDVQLRLGAAPRDGLSFYQTDRCTCPCTFTRPAGTCSSATCVSSGAIAGRGPATPESRPFERPHFVHRVQVAARVGVPRRIGPGRRRRSPAPSVPVGRRANRLAGRSRRQVTSTRSGVYRAGVSKSPSQCRTGRSARTANAPMRQSMRTRTVSPRPRHCRYSTAT